MGAIHPVQEHLSPMALSKGSDLVEMFMMGNGGESPLEESRRILETKKPGQPFAFADFGCGSGVALEEMLLRLREAFPQHAEQISGVGVDLNPSLSLATDEQIQQLLVETGQVDPDENFNGWSPAVLRERYQRLARYLEASVDDVVLEPESLDLIYSVNTLIYVEDVLRAIERGYHALRVGGKMIIDIEKDWISLDPSWEEIVAQTPGAAEAFQYRKSPNPMASNGILIVTKMPNHEFKGFPFRKVATVTAEEVYDAKEARPPDPNDLMAKFKAMFAERESINKRELRPNEKKFRSARYESTP